MDCKTRITDTDLISIQYDNEGNLVADIEGPVVMRTKILNLELEDNGRTVNCLVFGAWTTKWEQVHSGKNEFSRMLLAYADKGAAQIDRVYYLAPDIETADEQFGSTSYAVSTSDLTDAQLIYETPESLNYGLVDEGDNNPD